MPTRMGVSWLRGVAFFSANRTGRRNQSGRIAASDRPECFILRSATANTTGFLTVQSCTTVQHDQSTTAMSLQCAANMKDQSLALTLPEIGLIAGTRAALGVGIGLLISDKLNKDQRRGAGLALLGVGVLTSIPLLIGMFGKGSGLHLLKRAAA